MTWCPCEVLKPTRKGAFTQDTEVFMLLLAKLIRHLFKSLKKQQFCQHVNIIGEVSTVLRWTL